ncbi:MAG: serine/threonine protein kinase [Gammaproteobacteria bacterium]|jgi:serine/threonine-protein kinase|nr:serine/threonine protein kinase [Gammaproteobacteria bacterium]MBT3859836.1 serine/threonine protein kinase [Gammaproteobacteria bacterium]MBT3988510.1 serine/threonine protein kinase [Gammaproteobacteria bacterium]MBT4256603.1 serine/threonine protein kinase [Gammaproteobacteria bacterium]MBT4583180.1 serine/threonine protein kinase [Gammaproteobacteria bacterium]
MINFPEPPKEYGSVFLEETDKPLPKKINQQTRYAFFSTIATGGKSLIKSCKDLHLSRFICYKTLKPEFADDEIEQQRLIREARVTAMLQHPNTVPTYELGRDSKGHCYFTMKLVHGYTLREILDFRDRYDLTQLVDVMLQVAYALEYAHKHGVAHRDIKPENILVGPYSEVLVLDWGLAKVWNPDGTAVEEGETAETKIEDISLTGQGKAQGTAHYMSPEQVKQDPSIDHRTDIFSLAAVMYEVLCGKPAPKGDKLHHIIESVLNDSPEKPSDVTSQRVPPLLEEMVMRALEKNPDNRYQSIREMIQIMKQDWRSGMFS